MCQKYNSFNVIIFTGLLFVVISIQLSTVTIMVINRINLITAIEKLSNTTYIEQQKVSERLSSIEAINISNTILLNPEIIEEGKN